jgi:hypothetical protein
VLGDAAMLFGSWIYGAYLTTTPLRTLFFVLQLFNAAASTFNLMVSKISYHWAVTPCCVVSSWLGGLTVGSRMRAQLALGTHTMLSVPSRIFAPLGNIAFWLAWQVQSWTHHFFNLFVPGHFKQSSARLWLSLMSALCGVAAQGTAGLHACCKDCAEWCGGDLGEFSLLECHLCYRRLSCVSVQMSIISAMNDLGGTTAKFLGAAVTVWLGIDSIPGSTCDGTDAVC